MSKSVIINRLVKQGLSKKMAEGTVNTFFGEITRSLINKEGVVLHKFGTFDVKYRQARRGSNPKTGESMTIPARWSVSFHYSKFMKDYL